MVGTIFVGFVMGAFDMAWQSATAVALDNAALHASRAGSLGRRNPDGTRAGKACKADILEVARRAGGGLLGGDLRLDITSYDSAKGALDDDPRRTNGTSGAGLGGHTVVYELRYTRSPVFKPFFYDGKQLGRDRHTHTAIVTVQNEPFSNGDPDAAPCA